MLEYQDAGQFEPSLMKNPNPRVLKGRAPMLRWRVGNVRNDNDAIFKSTYKSSQGWDTEWGAISMPNALERKPLLLRCDAVCIPELLG